MWPWRRRRRASPVDVDDLIRSHLDAGEPSGWFEPLYVAARGDAAALPWGASGGHPYVTQWLDRPVAAVPGRRAVVVGCGLGDDAAELARRGFEVTAFDIAPSAIAWARRRFPDAAVEWRTLDVLALPDECRASFDLIVEVDTVPWLPGLVRDAAMQAIGGLAAPGGVALVVTRLATSQQATQAARTPPWPQAPSELAAYRAGGLHRVALEHPPADGVQVLEARLTLTSGPPTAGPGDLPPSP